MISRKAEYAILILAEMALHNRNTRLSSREIAANRSIPVNLVSQLLPVLRKSGWISGTRGPKGGIVLVVDPAKLSLHQVIEAVDGKTIITRCLTENLPCSAKKHCPLRTVWQEAQKSMTAKLSQVTIKELSINLLNDN